ncbi:uncharacterized protein STEHIDRAFT_124774 [Stereum hirsutum FP-91666 SS1]|uniref:uncharacterized protein n=1 Tax=Stereum hirsutum (strain FP-91666) TaxID=721885 RepID=UPI0004449549|nr:uncharacterized protein STEHIDRAFT_124774 [Stereum hirsutum FP-91666 SS1]EIM81908.1 hypothetical protein STEHIDRAFT_124774 [Stereum hirsutum FP-91666 SS1]
MGVGIMYSTTSNSCRSLLSQRRKRCGHDYSSRRRSSVAHRLERQESEYETEDNAGTTCTSLLQPLRPFPLTECAIAP